MQSALKWISSFRGSCINIQKSQRVAMLLSHALRHGVQSTIPTKKYIMWSTAEPQLHGNDFYFMFAEIWGKHSSYSVCAFTFQQFISRIMPFTATPSIWELLTSSNLRTHFVTENQLVHWFSLDTSIINLRGGPWNLFHPTRKLGLLSHRTYLISRFATSSCWRQDFPSSTRWGIGQIFSTIYGLSNTTRLNLRSNLLDGFPKISTPRWLVRYLDTCTTGLVHPENTRISV